MTPNFTIRESDVFSQICVGFKNGEEIFVFFFPRVETKVEAYRQGSWKLIQRLLKGEMYHEKCEGCGLATACIAALLATVILFIFSPFAGMIVGLVSFIALSCALYHWHTTRPAREMKLQQRLALLPIQKRLYAFAEEDDFCGAVEYVLRCCAS